MRGLRDVERKIEQVEQTGSQQEPVSSDEQSGSSKRAEAQIAKRYIAATRALLLEDGEPPLELPGLLIFERAKIIQESLERCLAKKGASSPRKNRPNIQ